MPSYDPADLSVLEQAYSWACRDVDIDPRPIDSAMNKAIEKRLPRPS